MEIIVTISENAEFAQKYKLAFFYCLFFCIYFNNQHVLKFLRTLINKVAKVDTQTLELLKQIDTHGLECLRQQGTELNSVVYHQAMYQAFNDKLRVV